MTTNTEHAPASAAPQASQGLPLPIPWREFIAQSKFVPHEGAFLWAIRQHQVALAKAQAVLLIRGRRYVYPDRFERVLIEHGLAQAAKVIEHGDGQQAA
jgi:hypothetical protein